MPESKKKKNSTKGESFITLIKSPSCSLAPIITGTLLNLPTQKKEYHPCVI